MFGFKSGFKCFHNNKAVLQGGCMQKRVTVLASPEEALVIDKRVDREAMIDAITAISDRTEAICDLLVGSIQCDLIKSHSLCNVIWQLQANMDYLTLFVNCYLKQKHRLCASLIDFARKKATEIIMSHSSSNIAGKSFEEVVEGILTIKQYIKAVTSIACYQESL